MRSIILGALGAIVAIVFFKLVFDSQGSKDAAVGDAELETALSEYRRDKKRATSAADVQSARAIIPKSRAKTGASRDDGDDGSSNVTRPFTKPPPLVDDEPEEEIDLKSGMDNANRFYDKGDYEGARDAALDLLAENPKNVRMTRIVVSSSCIMGDEEIATKHFSKLPPRDQRQMARRCKRYGIEFDDQDQ